MDLAAESSSVIARGERTVTTDFIVFATDTEQAELLTNLRAAILARLLNHHRRRFWSPE